VWADRRITGPLVEMDSVARLYYYYGFQFSTACECECGVWRVACDYGLWRAEVSFLKPRPSTATVTLGVGRNVQCAMQHVQKNMACGMLVRASYAKRNRTGPGQGEGEAKATSRRYRHGHTDTNATCHTGNSTPSNDKMVPMKPR
jgi:hypothetical protein